jgi:Phosphotransferase system IIB components
MVSIQSDDNQQRLLILPILLLTFAHMPQVMIASIDYTGHLWLTIFKGLQQSAPLLLAMSIAISRSRYRYDMQPLNACLSYVLIAKLLHNLGPEHIPTEIIAALLSGYAVVLFTPYTQKIRLPAWLRAFQGDAVVLLCNGFFCMLLALPAAALLHLFNQYLLHNQTVEFLLWLEPWLLLAGGTMSPLQITPSAWHSFLASPYVWLIVLCISWIFQRALLHIAGTKTQKRVLNAVLSLLMIATGQPQPMLLLLLLWAPRHCIYTMIVLGFINHGCHWLQQEQITYAKIPSVWFAIPMSLFGILLYEFSRHIIQHPIHFPNAEAVATAETQSATHESELLLDVDFLTISYLKAMGGLGNITALRADLTRLIVDVETVADMDKSRLHHLGVMSIKVISTQRAELVTGPIALTLESRIQNLARRQSLDLTPREIHPLMPFRLD